MSVGAATPSPAPQARAPGATTLTPDLRQRWRSVRVPVIAVAVLFAVTFGLAVLSTQGTGGRLDPASFEPAGSHALAALLREAGVEVRIARTIAEVDEAGPDATVLVTYPQRVPADVLGEAVRDAAGVILVEPGPGALDALDTSLVPRSDGDVEARTPGCALPLARLAGEVDLGGLHYGTTERTPADLTICYADPAEPAEGPLVRSGRVTVLGEGAPLTNERLDQRGNAALGLGLLGERDTLVWYVPALDDPALRAGGAKSLETLLPDSVKLGLLQLAIGAVVLALWRARRLGPVVGEPLPVIVRAAESTEGLARLYRRSGAHDRAAAALRAAALRALAPRLGFPAVGADPAALTEALARRLGRSTAQLADLLFGPPPVDDAGLVRLADDLDALASQLREGTSP